MATPALAGAAQCRDAAAPATASTAGIGRQVRDRVQQIAASVRASVLYQQLPYFIRRPLSERGTYELTETDIETYYASHPATAGVIELRTPLRENVKFKVNERDDFQAENWFTYYRRLKEHQHRWTTNVRSFIAKEGVETFNEAKRKFFGRLAFDMKLLLHERPYHFLKEWGHLNHPPFDNLRDKDLSKFSRNYKPIDYRSRELDKSKYFDENFHREVDRLSQSELTAGNRFRLVPEVETLRTRVDLIESARESVWVTSLVMVNDAAAAGIARALMAKAGEGIEVKFILESSLAYVHGSLLRQMRRAGVQVIRADDLARYNSATIYHSKLMIIDGRSAILGGTNLLDADLGSKGTDFKNRDLDVLVEGPMVTDMRANFAEDWNHFAQKNTYVGRNRGMRPFTQPELDAIEAVRAQERERGLRGSSHYSRWLKDPDQRMNGIGRYIAQKPYKNLNTITEAYLLYLDAVATYLGITNPVPWDTRTEAPATRGMRPHYLSFNNFNRLHDKVQELMRERASVRVDYVTSGGDFAANEAVPMTVDRIANYVDRGAYIRANANQAWLDSATPFLNRLKKPFENLLNDYVIRAKKPGTTVTAEEVFFDNVEVWIHLAFIHQKLFYFDRVAASIGSFNFLQNATDHAYESTAIIQDAALNREIDHAMVLDMANSFPFTFKQIDR